MAPLLKLCAGNLPYLDGVGLVVGSDLGLVLCIVSGSKVLGVDHGHDALDLGDGTFEFAALLGHLDELLNVRPDYAVIVGVFDEEAQLSDSNAMESR